MRAATTVSGATAKRVGWTSPGSANMTVRSPSGMWWKGTKSSDLVEGRRCIAGPNEMIVSRKLLDSIQGLCQRGKGSTSAVFQRETGSDFLVACMNTGRGPAPGLPPTHSGVAWARDTPGRGCSST
jgi:hypothetical protein